MLTVSKPQHRRSPGLCSHRETTWKPTHLPGEVGRSRPSPATSNATARRSAPTFAANGRPASADRRSRIRSPRSRRISPPASPTIPISQLTALFDEVGRLGYPRSYPSFVRAVRAAGLRPHCEPCRGVSGRATIEIEHPPGAEIQWDWFERRHAPWGGTAYVLLGTLPHSSRVRGVLAPSLDQAHLIEAMDAVLRRLGGTARDWRTDRLATVIVPGSADVQPSFAPVAKHYGVVIRPCPPRRGNRKGAVEASVRYLCGRWWRTLSATTMIEAQASLDRFCATVADARPRAGHRPRPERRPRGGDF